MEWLISDGRIGGFSAIFHATEIVSTTHRVAGDVKLTGTIRIANPSGRRARQERRSVAVGVPVVAEVRGRAVGRLATHVVVAIGVIAQPTLRTTKRLTVHSTIVVGVVTDLRLVPVALRKGEAGRGQQAHERED
jgi:hypothetical protein